MKPAVVILIIFFVNLEALTQDNPRINILLQEADAELEKSNFSEALRKVENALVLSPGNVRALEKRVNIYYQMNEIKEASKCVNEAIIEFPAESELYYLRGLINISRKKYYKAINDFNKIFELEQPVDFYKVYLNRAIANTNLQEYELAIEDLTKSIELNSTNASAYHSRGMVYYELKDYNLAVNDFKQAINLSHDNPVTFFNLGMSYYRLEDKESACPYFHKACSLGDKNACRMAFMECAKNLPK
jgi:tetratricopeptide (TPR) repeat protein